ncbi:hypothetical protein [Bradyrhizobium embrapense]
MPGKIAFAGFLEEQARLMRGPAAKIRGVLGYADGAGEHGDRGLPVHVRGLYLEAIENLAVVERSEGLVTVAKSCAE